MSTTATAGAALPLRLDPALDEEKALEVLEKATAAGYVKPEQHDAIIQDYETRRASPKSNGKAPAAPSTPAKGKLTRDEVLDQLMEGKLTKEQASRLLAANGGRMTFKVSDKGALSVYGMGKWPVTLYREQWERLLDKADEIRQFIADNDADLKHKGD